MTINAVLGVALWASLAAAPLAPEPIRITSAPAEDYMPSLSPDGAYLAFVSSRAGAHNIWIKSMTENGLPAPVRLTASTSGDKSPAFSPDGRALVYASLSSDAEGDIYIIDLPKTFSMATAPPVPRRLTDDATADSEPVFAPGGGAVIYTSADKKRGKADLWRLDLETLERTRLTAQGGRSPSVSPDGAGVVFVSNRALYTLGLATGAVEQITDGRYMDAFPAFADDRTVVFSRYAVDTNGDGQVTIDDNPALYSLDLGRRDASPVPVTSAEIYSLFPAPHGGRVYYMGRRDGQADIYSVALAGMAPGLGDLAAEARRAERIELYYPERPLLWAMAWRASWAAHRSEGSHSLLAGCLYREAVALAMAGAKASARESFASLLALYPGQRRLAGQARIEMTLIDARKMSLYPDVIMDRMEKIELEYSDERSVAARARVERGSAALAAGKPAEAFGHFDYVSEAYPDIREAAAEAAFRKSEVYAALDRGESLTGALVNVIRAFPDQGKWRELAAAKIQDLAGKGESLAASVAGLTAVVEKYEDLPFLQASAMNRIAALYRENGESQRAREVYAKTAARFPGEEGERVKALFAIASIHTEEENFEKALEIYESVERDTSAKKEVYERAKRERVRQWLRKAAWELAQGDKRLAAKTYRRLIEYDDRVTGAHRGLIQSLVAAGETAKAVDEYEAMVKERPDDPQYLYALGLAVTYLDPPALERAGALIEKAVSKDRANSWFHQTLGWVYEQMENRAPGGPYAEQALGEYRYALTLAGTEADARRVADLRLNIGNASYALGAFNDARASYKARLELGVEFADRRVESLFYQRLGECEYRLGDDEASVAAFEKALALAGENETGRKIEILERMGLSCQSMGRWARAVEYFSKGLSLRRKTGQTAGEGVALRNIANNLFFLSQEGGLEDREALRQALYYYRQSETAAGKPAPEPREKRRGPSLFSIGVETGVGGVKGAYRGFSEAEEKKLIFHHIGRIYGELGDYDKAVEYFEKKLALTPRKLPLIDNAPVLTEKAIILNQIGFYLHRLGRTEEAIGRFAASMELCADIGAVSGMLINAGNMTGAALERPGDLSPETLDKVISLSAAALDKAEKGNHAERRAMNEARLGLGQLYHARFLRGAGRLGEGQTKGAGAAALAGAYRLAGADAYLADEAYRTVMEIGEGGAGRLAISAMINLGLLRMDEGKSGEAGALLEQAASKARLSALPDLEWQAEYFKFMSGPDKHSGSLDRAAGAVAHAPLGFYGAENPSVAAAVALSIFDGVAEKAYAAGDATAAASAIERGLGAIVKLGAAGLARARLADGAGADVSALSKILSDRPRGGGGNGAESMEPWRTGYGKFINDLRGKNRLLAYMAAPGEPDFESVSASLKQDEAAVTLWKRDGGAALFVVTPGGLLVGTIGEGEAVAAALERIPELAGVTRIFWATHRPLTDPVAAGLSQRYTVAAVPSFMYIPIVKERRNINDFTLAMFGFGDSADPAAPSGAFHSAAVIDGPGARKKAVEGAVRGAGVLALAPAPVAGGEDALQTRFYLSGGVDAPEWVTLKEILESGAQGTVLVTPPVRGTGGERPGAEGALVALAALAGYPTWVIGPPGEDAREVFIKDFLGNIGKSPLAGAFAAAASPGADAARLVGALGFDETEKTEYAKRNFTGFIRAGVEALKEGELAIASENLQKALVCTKAAGVDEYDEVVLNRLADIEYRLGRVEAALEYQRRLTGIYEESERTEKLAESLYLTGVMQERLMKYGAAVESLRRSYELYEKLGLPGGMAAAASGLGLAEEGDARYAAAMEAFETARGAWTAAGDKPGAARELRRIARIYHLRLNNFDAAREAYEKAVAALEEAGETGGALMARIERGALEVDAGGLAKAEEVLKAALGDAEKTGDEAAAALAAFHMGNVHWFRGEYETALGWVRRCLKAAEELNDDRLAAMAHNTMGLVYWTVNDERRAMASLEKSLELARKTEARLDEASALNNMGLVHRKAGRLDAAIKSFEGAREIDERLESQWGLAYDARNLSVCHLMKQELGQAERLAREALEISARIGDRINQAKAALQLAEVLAAKGERDEAAAAFERAGSLAREVGSPETEWRALLGSGRAMSAEGNAGGAIAAYKRAVDVVERMRADIKIEELKSGFLDDKQDLYEELILLLLERGAVREAFVYAERAKARSFIDLVGAVKINFADKLSQDEYDKVKELKRRVEELSRATGAGQTLKELAEKRRAAAAELEKAIEKIRLDNPGLAPFVTVEPVDPDRLLELLGPDTALVEYVVARERIVMFVIGGGEVRAFVRPVNREELGKLVARFRKLIQDGAPLREEARELGAILVDPVIEAIGGARAIGIVPHRDLHYLSFAALALDDGYLIDRAPVFYLPAASLLERALETGPGGASGESRALAIGNPDLGDLNTDLPLSEFEALSVKWTFPFTDVLLRGDATETAALKNLGEYNVLHIASHGQFDPANPLLSALRFAPDEDNDGALTAREVFALNLDAQLVVMSACQTGLGAVSDGDEIVGLNRAFLFSGARTVISTLWRVDDLASAVLMKHFYRNVGKETAAMALRKAQMTVKSKWPHPANWAGFVLVGDYQ